MPMGNKMRANDIEHAEAEFADNDRELLALERQLEAAHVRMMEASNTNGAKD
jgi:hypothetical protein